VESIAGFQRTVTGRLLQRMRFGLGVTFGRFSQFQFETGNDKARELEDIEVKTQNN
jgi:hypothetical protein